MAVTIRSDLIVPEVLADAIAGEFAGVQALYGSGAGFVTGQGWPDARGGDTIKIPYFGTIGEFEDLADDEGAGGAVPALTPAKLTSTSETATVKHSGKAFETTEWARLATMYADPYAEAARQLRRGLERLIDKRLLEAASTTTLEHDIYDPTGAAGAPTWEEILEARFLWGDEQEDLALMVMHSDVALRLLKEKDGDNRPIWADVLKSGTLPAEILGIPVKISDRATKTPDYGETGSSATGYETLLVKRGALAFWFNGGEPDVQTDRDILADSTIAAVHTYYAAHRYDRLAGTTKTGVVKFIHN